MMLYITLSELHYLSVTRPVSVSYLYTFIPNPEVGVAYNKRVFIRNVKNASSVSMVWIQLTLI